MYCRKCGEKKEHIDELEGFCDGCYKLYIKQKMVEQMKMYLKIFPEASKGLIIDIDGNILEEVERES